MTHYTLGADPGRSAALALLDDTQPRPHLLGAWSVYGADGPWTQRLDGALSAIRLLTDGHEVSAIIESPAGGQSRHPRRADTWWGMGIRAGRMFEAIRLTLGATPEWIAAGEWPGRLNVRVGKLDSAYGIPRGWHRVGEAAGWLESGAEYLGPARWHQGAAESDAAAERMVAVAEAVLIGVAGARR